MAELLFSMMSHVTYIACSSKIGECRCRAVLHTARDSSLFDITLVYSSMLEHIIENSLTLLVLLFTEGFSSHSEQNPRSLYSIMCEGGWASVWGKSSEMRPSLRLLSPNQCSIFLNKCF